VCHKCRATGHVSKDCPEGRVATYQQPAPQCLNCGGDHLLQDCPIKEKVCHKCRRTGHISKDCPEPSIGYAGPTQKCLNCGGDHLLAVCPIKEKVCHKCGQPGHISRDCPLTSPRGNKSDVQCLNCGGDHEVRNCPSPKICHRCGKTGHISKECRERPMDAGASARADLRTDAVSGVPTGTLVCFNCGEAHNVKDCPIPTKICHQCGGRGHISKQCPSRGQPAVLSTVAGVAKSRITAH
jgi:cellular nucleic acid-binding protein